MACLAGILAGSAAVAGEGVDVTYAGGLLTVRCADAELAEVLEQIGTATGMSLVLDEAVKSTSLTADIEAQPVQLALERLLEGRGVTYAMSLSADGQKVAQMYVGTDAEARNAASAGAPRLRAPAVPVPAAHRTPEPAGLPAFGRPDGLQFTNRTSATTRPHSPASLPRPFPGCPRRRCRRGKPCPPRVAALRWWIRSRGRSRCLRALPRRRPSRSRRARSTSSAHWSIGSTSIALSTASASELVPGLAVISTVYFPLTFFAIRKPLTTT